MPLSHPQLETWLETQACALTRNRTSNVLVSRPALNPLSHTSQGRISFAMEVFLPSATFSPSVNTFWAFYSIFAGLAPSVCLSPAQTRSLPVLSASAVVCLTGISHSHDPAYLLVRPRCTVSHGSLFRAHTSSPSMTFYSRTACFSTQHPPAASHLTQGQSQSPDCGEQTLNHLSFPTPITSLSPRYPSPLAPAALVS